MIEVRPLTDVEHVSALENVGDMDPPGIFVDGELVAVALSPGRFAQLRAELARVLGDDFGAPHAALGLVQTLEPRDGGNAP